MSLWLALSRLENNSDTNTSPNHTHKKSIHAHIMNTVSCRELYFSTLQPLYQKWKDVSLLQHTDMGSQIQKGFRICLQASILPPTQICEKEGGDTVEETELVIYLIVTVLCVYLCMYTHHPLILKVAHREIIIMVLSYQAGDIS